MELLWYRWLYCTVPSYQRCFSRSYDILSPQRVWNTKYQTKLTQITVSPLQNLWNTECHYVINLQKWYLARNFTIWKIYLRTVLHLHQLHDLKHFFVEIFIFCKHTQRDLNKREQNNACINSAPIWSYYSKGTMVRIQR